MSELADGLLELTLSCVVLVITQSDRAGVERGDVRPRSAARRAEERVQFGTSLANANHEPALLRVGAEASPPVGGEERIVGHPVRGHLAAERPEKALDAASPWPPILCLQISRAARRVLARRSARQPGATPPRCQCQPGNGDDTA